MKPFSALIAAGVFSLAAAPALSAEVTIGMQLEPPALDPTSGAAAAIDEIVYSNVFEGLVKFAEDGSVVPGLAESWEVQEFGLIYDFNLRKGVKFHDGTDFTAEDAKFSIDRIAADDSANAQKALYASILQTEVIDEHTFRIVLTQPTGAFLFNLAWGDAVMVAPESAGDNANNPVGTGPFRFSRWAKGDSVELVKNPD
ncbi:MAG: ABC transporter substrate-binding protein, partial [Pseudomonadota bacterium]